MTPRTLQRVLVIDDDELFCRAVQISLKNDSREILAAYTGADGVAMCGRHDIDVALVDQRLPDGPGIKLCDRILAHNDQTKIVFITAHPSLVNAVEAIRNGAFDYLSKPFEMMELELVLERARQVQRLESIERVHERMAEKETAAHLLVGDSPAMELVRHLIATAATSEATVLITGETGTGKNVVARCIHAGRDHRLPFIAVTCGALPENLIESELFGYERGAFTGATAMRRGAFELAEAGTLFLDEIATMPLHLQSKLLGVLDDKIIRRLGGETTRWVNARIIAATNSTIEEAVRHGTFRDDLYHRLNLIRIHMPPLRDHVDDIPVLCQHFIREIVRDRRLPVLPKEELAKLRRYRWPGNIRELRNVIERSLILSQDEELRPSELFSLSSSVGAQDVSNDADAVLLLRDVEKRHILRVFRYFHSNYTRTARALGVGISTLRRKLSDYSQSIDSKSSF